MEDVSDGTPEAPWYSAGLRFHCTGCGKCCSGPSGSVYLSQADSERLAAFLHMRTTAFLRRYTTRSRLGPRALVNRPDGTACVFLEGTSCSVYDARPVQCRTYPWWFSNIRDPESWAETAAACEGIDHPGASLVPAATILEQAALDAENDERMRWAARP